MIQGTSYEPQFDYDRLHTQLEHVRGLMLSSTGWVTLREIEDSLGYPGASISARLRDLRNKYGYDVQRRRRGNPKLGLFEYRVVRKEMKQERLF